MATTRIGLVDPSAHFQLLHMPAEVWHPAAGFFIFLAARLAPSQDAQPQRFRARSPARPSESAHVRAAGVGRRLLPFALRSTFSMAPREWDFIIPSVHHNHIAAEMFPAEFEPATYGS